MRVAFVHDYLTQFGGAERVLLEMQPLYPEAPIYTSIYDPDAFAGRLAGVDVRTSFLQKLPGAKTNFRALLPLYPKAFESLDLRRFDLVISSTTSFAKGVFVAPGAVHISYINTPTRFLWYPQEYALDVTPAALRPALALLSPALRRWDFAAAQRPHHLIANSRNVAQRIREVYQRPSEVVHCPVDVAAFEREAPVGDYYLVMSRLLPYKRIALAIEACSSVGARLIVAGSGPDEARLQSLANVDRACADRANVDRSTLVDRRAGRMVEFVGHVDDEMRKRLICSARALIVPGIEDFGLVALEAAAAGRPTVAFAAGGALETVVEGETGLFFAEPHAHALAQTLQKLANVQFDRARMQAHARRFAPAVFRAKLKALIARALAEV